jgi:hypothetical protein
MNGSSNNLQRRLRARRYDEAARKSEEILDRIGVTVAERRVVCFDDIETLWPRLLEKLIAGGDVRERWAADEVKQVGLRIDQLRHTTADERLIWFTLADDEPIAIEVPAGPVLNAALPYLVSRANDLLLASHNLEDGVSVELNYVPPGNEYEMVTWGRFSP